MLGNFEGWLLPIVVITLVWGYLLYSRGPAAALAAAVVLSFAFPVWPTLNIGGLPLSIQTAVAAVAMLGYVVHPKGKILSPLTLLDFSIAIICICHVTSDTLAEGFNPGFPFRAYGEWALPYVSGRYAIRDRESLKWVAAWVSAVLMLLGLFSCCEALTKVNLFEVVFGDRPDGLARRDGQRFGLKRATGPTTHSIFFGILLAVLTPWLVYLWQAFNSSRARQFTIIAGITAIAGTALTMARTPVLTLIVAIALALALRVKSLRWPVGLSMACAIGGFLAFPTQVTDVVSRWTGGGDKPWLIEIDGEAVISSSSRTRLHVFSIYKDAMIKGGPFGYGSRATSSFPLRIPSMEAIIKSSNLFVTVDNAYILITLRFGWIGGICLALLLLSAIMTALSLYFDRPDRFFPGALACMLVVIALLSFLLVFMSYDFGFQILWTIGVLSGLASTRSKRST